jgi:predicted glycosyltransferase
VSRTIRVVCYAVNGSGVGHLTRLQAIARWMRRYASAAGVRAEIWFLTSCEADGILFGDGFPSFKLPSKTVIADAGYDKLAYLALAKQWVWHSLALLRPDLLIVDTFPRGAFGELLGALDLVRRKAFVYRPTKPAFAARADFQAMLPLYDALVVPETRARAAVQVPAAAQARLHFVGPIVSCDAVDLVSRAQARADLGIEGDRLAILVSAGGGGDPGVPDHLARVHEACAGDDSVHLVIGAGPLHRGPKIRGPRTTFVEGPGLGRSMRAFDLAICAAGYNTWHELMLAGVPALFVPQEKIADDQDLRARRAVDAGAAALLDLEDPKAIRAAIDRHRDPAVRAAASDAARSLVPRSHARDAAAELLRLVLPGHEVDAAEDLVTDELLAATGPRIDAYLALLRALAGGGDLRGESTVAIEAFDALGTLPGTSADRFVELVVRKLPAATIAERAQAIVALVAAFRPFGDWAGALILLAQVERQAGARAFVGKLVPFLSRLRERGADLYAGIAELARGAATAEPAAVEDGAISREGPTGGLDP